MLAGFARSNAGGAIAGSRRSQPPQDLLPKAINPTPLSSPAAVPAATARLTLLQPDDDDERLRLAAPEAVSFAGFGFARAGGLSARRGVDVLPRVCGSGRDGV